MMSIHAVAFHIVAKLQTRRQTESNKHLNSLLEVITDPRCNFAEHQHKILICTCF